MLISVMNTMNMALVCPLYVTPKIKPYSKLKDLIQAI